MVKVLRLRLRSGGLTSSNSDEAPAIAFWWWRGLRAAPTSTRIDKSNCSGVGGEGPVERLQPDAAGGAYIQKTRETTDFDYLNRASKILEGVLAEQDPKPSACATQVELPSPFFQGRGVRAR